LLTRNRDIQKILARIKEKELLKLILGAPVIMTRGTKYENGSIPIIMQRMVIERGRNDGDATNVLRMHHGRRQIYLGSPNYHAFENFIIFFKGSVAESNEQARNVVVHRRVHHPSYAQRSQ
jgi:hypothetical protein